MSRELEIILGYSSRADVLLQRRDGSKRLWIEFEVSRADPVANHAKFATSHLFQPQQPTDVFISMVSSHVQRGRRNLAANTISLMRQIGMSAFQTVLFSQIEPLEIKRINHLSLAELFNENLDVDLEISRVLAVSEEILDTSERRIHFAGDLIEVMLNLRHWNRDIAKSKDRNKWGKRTITYFVYDPHSQNFAPSKFCAYVAIPSVSRTFSEKALMQQTSEMSIDLYVTLDGTDSRFDGRRAQSHLIQNLGMRSITSEQIPEITQRFEKWLKYHDKSINVHPRGVVFLLPRVWFG